MTILNGKLLSQKIQKTVALDIVTLKNDTGHIPGLAVILIGNDLASHLYVNMKKKACEDAKIYSIVHEMPDDIPQEAIINTIKTMNENSNIDGILVQLPLPKHIDEVRILQEIEPRKDVDGFHPFNVGRLTAGLDGFVPCTPLGVMEMLASYNINLKGMNAVVIGTSNIVGKPISSLLLNKQATVTICHSKTKNLKLHTLKADIICVGAGVINLITQDMVKPDVIIIDIGINKIAEGKIRGDVDFANVSKKASFITPVPGGVGPMTIAMLLKNTLKAAQINRKI